MINDFTGNELHKALRQDLMREAEGGRLLKAAGVDRPGWPIGIPVLKAIGALIVTLLIALGLAR